MEKANRDLILEFTKILFMYPKNDLKQLITEKWNEYSRKVDAEYKILIDRYNQDLIDNEEIRKNDIEFLKELGDILDYDKIRYDLEYERMVSHKAIEKLLYKFQNNNLSFDVIDFAKRTHNSFKNMIDIHPSKYVLNYKAGFIIGFISFFFGIGMITVFEFYYIIGIIGVILVSIGFPAIVYGSIYKIKYEKTLNKLHWAQRELKDNIIEEYVMLRDEVADKNHKENKCIRADISELNKMKNEAFPKDLKYIFLDVATLDEDSIYKFAYKVSMECNDMNDLRRIYKNIRPCLWE